MDCHGEQIRSDAQEPQSKAEDQDNRRGHAVPCQVPNKIKQC